MKKNTRIIVIVIVIVIVPILLSISWIYLKRTYPTTPPLKSGLYKLESFVKPHAKMQKEATGFLAYWRLDEADHLRLDLLTEVSYFGLVVDGEGNFVKEINGETDPGWREWNSQKIMDLIAQTQIMGAEFSVTIVCQNNDNIESLLENKDYQEKLIDNILEETKSRKLDGVNIDFEYLGEADPEYRQKFTDFSKLLKQKLNADSPKTKLALSIMPRAARDPNLFDFKSLAPVYDKFIGMSYEYAGASSDIATATAPLKGFSENKFFFDITTTYEDYLKTIPKEKIIMGVPYYGWEWAVEEGRQIQSRTFPASGPDSYAAVMSYARAKESTDLKENQCEFDEYAMQPWCWYTNKETGLDHQIWFEDEKSIGIKYDFAREKDLGGIAIWILGYDKDRQELWNLMRTKFAAN
jgi:spore germination protein YaaH